MVSYLDGRLSSISFSFFLTLKKKKVLSKKKKKISGT